MVVNRREYPRVKLFKFNVEVSKKGEHSYVPVEVVNISAGGLCFLSRSIIYQGDALEFRFPFKHTTVIMPARVVRINVREIGVQFSCSQDEIAEFVATYNEEIQSMAISTKENIHIVLPGYTDQAQEKNSIDTLLDLGPETKH